MLLSQREIPFFGEACKFLIRLSLLQSCLGLLQSAYRLSERAASLLQLLVYLRRSNHRNKFPSLHFGTDVHKPLLQVAVGSSVDCSRIERFDIAGQQQLGRCLSLSGMQNRNQWMRYLRFIGGCESLAVAKDTRHCAYGEESGQNYSTA